MSGGQLTGYRPGGIKEVMTMKTLELDLETFSDVDLLSAGVYPYAESSQFDLLLFGYSVDGGEVQVVDVVNGECIPVPAGVPIPAFQFHKGTIRTR